MSYTPSPSVFRVSRLSWPITSPPNRARLPVFTTVSDPGSRRMSDTAFWDLMCRAVVTAVLEKICAA